MTYPYKGYRNICTLEEFIYTLYDGKFDKGSIKKIKKCQLLLSGRTIQNITLSKIQRIICKSRGIYKKQLSLYAFIFNQLHKKKYNINDISFQDLNLLWSYIALFDALKESEQIMLISIRIKDPRNILHPHTDLCTAKYLSHIYNILYWITCSVSQSYLYMANCSPLSELAVTLSRATLLVSGQKDIDNLKKIEVELNSILFNMGLPIQITAHYEKIDASGDLVQKLFSRAVKNCNKSDITKKEEETGFYSHHNKLHDITKFCWRKFINIKSPNIVCNKLNKTKTLLPVEITSSFNCSEKKAYKEKLLWEKNSEKGELYNSFVKDFNILPFSMGRLRMDVKGFLDSMILFGGYMLDLHQSYRSYHKQFFYFDIPRLILKHQDKFNSVFLMHSVSDDCCLIGCISKLEIISMKLTKLYEEKYQGKLKCSIEPFQEGYTVADWSFRVLKKI